MSTEQTRTKHKTFRFTPSDLASLKYISEKLQLTKAAALRMALHDVELRLRGRGGLLAQKMVVGS